MSSVEDGAEGEHNRYAVSRRVLDRASTPSNILQLLSRIRHPNGAINHGHPDIRGVMKQAREYKLDVVMVARGKGIDAVAGRFLADHDRLVKIGAGVAISTVIAAGAVGFVLRKHRR